MSSALGRHIILLTHPAEHPIIIYDRHLKVLIGSGFKPQPITPEEFIRRILAASGA